MNIRIKKILFYQENTKLVFRKWLDSLNKNESIKVDNRLYRLLLGNFGDYKALGKELYELRINHLRVYFSIIDSEIVLLLGGGNKNTKKGQTRDIEKAREHLERFKQNG